MENIIGVQHLKNNLGGQWVHTDVNFTVKKGEIIAIIGGSGCGKTTLLRSILRLIIPTGGEISVFGQDLNTATDKEFLSVQKRWSMMFQSGALFTNISVFENIAFPLREHTKLSEAMVRDIVLMQLEPALHLRF